MVVERNSRKEVNIGIIEKLLGIELDYISEDNNTAQEIVFKEIADLLLEANKEALDENICVFLSQIYPKNKTVEDILENFSDMYTLDLENIDLGDFKLEIISPLPDTGSKKKCCARKKWSEWKKEWDAMKLTVYPDSLLYEWTRVCQTIFCEIKYRYPRYIDKYMDYQNVIGGMLNPDKSGCCCSGCNLCQINKLINNK